MTHLVLLILDSLLEVNADPGLFILLGHIKHDVVIRFICETKSGTNLKETAVGNFYWN